MRKNTAPYQIIIVLFFSLAAGKFSFATNYLVSSKTDLQTRMSAALPGDTVIVSDNTYNWGTITFTNNNGNSALAPIVMKSQTIGGVIFNGTTRIEFKGTNIELNGFTFNNGNAGTSAVIRFGTSSTNVSNYCRITNITIDNYNTAGEIENDWVGIYGIRNRVDHCTFINKANPRATVVVWYTSVTYPAPAVSTYHRIDSNYFKKRTYMGANGGETIRVGDSNTSRTDGFNIIESNLFEDCTQAEPEIISNKSDFNTYRYNTFLNCDGGLTLRHGRYCMVYGNFFIRKSASSTAAYGVRVIDKGHKVFNNYFEGMNGNSGGTSQNRAAISLTNGVSTDTTDAAFANQYFPADSVVIAFNTIVDAKGGGGINLGGTIGGTIQPKGIILTNNLVKMNSGTALYINPANTSITYSSEGNKYQAPSGLGATTSGWQSETLTFGAVNNGILTPPALVTDAAINSSAYISLLAGLDIKNIIRSAVYDVGCEELNGTGNVTNAPLDSSKVGAGSGFSPLSSVFISFSARKEGIKAVIFWQADNDKNADRYELEMSLNGTNFNQLAVFPAQNISGVVPYNYSYNFPANEKQIFYRVKRVAKTGTVLYSGIVLLNLSGKSGILIYPNPAASFINISTNGLTGKPEYRILDNLGKLARKGFLNSTGVDERIPVKGLGSGLYQVQVWENGILSLSKTVFISNNN